MGRSQSSFARTAMKLLCIFLGIILAGMLMITGRILDITGNTLEVPEFLRETADKFQFLGNAGRQEKVLNILLIGQDRREGEDQTRSDSMILCSFNRQTKQIVMTSFLRDLYLPIPGYGSNRINAAYALGGAPLLIRTLEENFDITIDGSVQVDFAQFSGILDRLGGVTLELRQDEAAEINRELGSTLTAGQQKLTGAEALAYSRIRILDPDGDFSRTDRQRKVLSALWDNYKDSSLTSLMKTAGTLLPMLETDMGSGELLSAAVSVFPYLSEAQIVSRKIPESDYCRDRVIDGMAVLEADMDTARERLRQGIYGGTEQPQP